MDLLGEAVSFAGIEEAMADIEKSAQNTELSGGNAATVFQKCSNITISHLVIHNH